MSEPEIDPPPPIRRPTWAWAVIGVYGVLAAILFLGPPVAGLFTGSVEGFAITAGITLLVFACGASLFMIPVPRGQRERVVTRRSIRFPILGSSLLAALVCCGFTLAFDEFFNGDHQLDFVNATVRIFAPVSLVWLGWLILFGTLALSRGPEAIGNRLWQALLVGSVAELLVAVPMHLVVRQRAQCCAGLATGFGIAVGVLVLFLALGPAVFVLCYRRYQLVYSRHSNPLGE